MAFVVAALRRNVTQKPDFRLVDRSAEKYLSTQLPQFFGHFTKRLAHWRAQGKDHLCIWPHGPLHFLPFHLFHADDRPLVEDWVVTTLPVLTLLNHVKLVSREGKPRLLSVGCADTGLAHGLPSVPEMPAQAGPLRALPSPTPPTSRSSDVIDSVGHP